MTRDDVTLLAQSLGPIFRDHYQRMAELFAMVQAKEKGLTGERGERGERGPEGQPGRDGRDAPPAAPGEKGKDGKDGRDGLGFEDLTIVHDGERTLTLRFLRGDLIKEWPIKIHSVLDRGVWTAGRVYERGDAVSWDGSLWIAQETNSEKPGEGGLRSKCWRLAVKKGRDGREGKVGGAGPAGPKGDKGDPGGATWKPR